MKVKDLIKELELYDKNLPVLVGSRYIYKTDIAYFNGVPVVKIIVDVCSIDES